MNTALLCHLVLQQIVYDSMPRRLHLADKGIGGDIDSEVCLFGATALHGLMMGMLV